MKILEERKGRTKGVYGFIYDFDQKKNYVSFLRDEKIRVDTTFFYSIPFRACEETFSTWEKLINCGSLTRLHR